MIDNNLSNEILLFFKNYLIFYKKLLHLETQKYNDIIGSKYELIDKHVNDEEAYMLKLRGFELERTKLMDRAGTSNLKVKEIIPLLDESVQDEFKTLYSDLTKVLANLKRTNMQSNYISKIKLHRIEAELNKLKNHPELKKSYNAQALTDKIASKSFSKMV